MASFIPIRTSTCMSHRSNRDREAEIKARQNTAGRFGFVLGSATALVALGINLWRAPRPWSWVPVALAVLLACLNIPLGIALGLLAERISRDSGERRR
jgi:hypothetical protein